MKKHLLFLIGLFYCSYIINSGCQAVNDLRFSEKSPSTVTSVDEFGMKKRQKSLSNEEIYTLVEFYTVVTDNDEECPFPGLISPDASPKKISRKQSLLGNSTEELSSFWCNHQKDEGDSSRESDCNTPIIKSPSPASEIKENLSMNGQFKSIHETSFAVVISRYDIEQ